MREHSRRPSKDVGSAKSPASLDNFTITFKRTTASTATYPSGTSEAVGAQSPRISSQRAGKRMFAKPTFIVSLSGLCGFILVVEDGEVDAYAGAFPSGTKRRPPPKYAACCVLQPS
jgi:hypothetical protein